MRRISFSKWEETFGPFEEHDEVPKSPYNKIWSFVQQEWDEEDETDKFILPDIVEGALKYYTTRYAYSFHDQEVAVTYN